MNDVLPMFPLGTVLVPGAVLPLHVFEERYRRLVRDLDDADRRFGVVLIERGHEVGGDDQRTDVGTIAEVVRAEELPDGRWALVAVGTERFRVARWLDDDPYPRAQVTTWPDESLDVPEDLRVTAVTLLERVLGLARDIGTDVPEVPELADDPARASWQATALAPLGPMDRQRLLCRPDPHDRLSTLVELLEEQEELLRFRRDGSA